MVFIGSDHGGYDLKQKAKQWLTDLGMEYKDLGDEPADPTDDYPDFAKLVALEVVNNPLHRGVLFGKSGGGMTIVANKFKGIRAVNIFDEATARQAREHLDANVMVLGARGLEDENAHKAVETFLTTMFAEDEERHKRRVSKMENA